MRSEVLRELSVVLEDGKGVKEEERKEEPNSECEDTAL